MSFKTTLTLLFVLIIVAVCWYFGAFGLTAAKPHEETAQAKSATDRLISPDLKDVKRLRLEIKGRGYLVFEKDRMDWRIIEPIRARAVSWRVGELVSAFTDAAKLQSGQPGKGPFANVSLEDMGLTDPAITVTLDADRSVTLQLGKQVVASDYIYVKTGGSDEIAVADVDATTLIKKDLTEYRDKRLWDINKANVTELTLVSRDGEQYKLAKPESRWVMLSPLRAAADKNAIDNVVDALVRVQAVGFVDAKLGKDIGPKVYGLDKPAWKITVATTEEVKPGPTTTPSEPAATQPASTQPTMKRTEYTLLIGDPSDMKADQVYAKLGDQDWIVTLSRDTLKQLTPDLVAWREKKLVDLSSDKISKIEIDRPKEPLTLVKKDDFWQLQLGNETTAAVDTLQVTQLLNTLAELQASNFVDQPSADLKTEGLDKPICRVRIFGADRVEPIDLALGATTVSKLFRYVKLSGVEYLAAVEDDKLADIFKPAAAYHDRQVLHFNTNDVVAIQVVAKGKPAYDLTRPDKNSPWSLSSPIQATADAKTVNDLLLACMTLRAQNYVGHVPLKSYGLDDPEIAVTLTTEEHVTLLHSEPTTTTAAATSTAPATTTLRQQHTLYVAQHGGKVYAVTPEATTPLVAEVTPQLFSDVSAELIDRQLFSGLSEALGQVNKLEIRRTGGSTELFEKKDNTWQYTADPFVQIDGQKIHTLLQALADLNAKHYVTFDVRDKDITRTGLDQPYLKITAWIGEKEYQLQIGRKSDNGRFALVHGGKDWLCEIEPADVEKFDKRLNPDFLVSKPEPEPSPPAMPRNRYPR